ncbi:hypothetical protein VTN77DRAFT_4053 [Rasamsonia byssochlamydoides]|uniref:uncharacterized protein n=1 Tax=Rasamsonia byssochlamydoides TaxID=89139 RepID=UPI003743565D
MTLYVVSLFLPYTIDFEAAGFRHSRYAPDGTRIPLHDKIEGRLADLRRHSRLKSLSMTPGATTDHEKIFKPFYASQSGAGEPHEPHPNEVRLESWGLSRKFNQPRSKAVVPPDSSILSRQDANVEAPNEPFIRNVDGQESESDSEEAGSPRVLLSDVDWVVKAAEQGNGGLRNAINAAVKAGILQDKVWVGTLGMPTDSLREHTRNSIAQRLQDEFESLTVFVGDSEFEGHYSHFSRTVLWPAFHYQMQEEPRHKEYDDHSWRQYVKVNEAFADTLAQRWKPGDRIWIHDYHLLLLPAMLRQRLPDAEIGFFMHSAFPSSEVFRCLTTREALLEGLLGADLIGFQTEEYCYHFLQTCSRLLRLEVSAAGVHLNDHLIPVRPFPIGIDSTSLNSLRESPEVKEWVSKIRDRYAGKHLIVARDRLDAAGGIKQKLLAYETFLQRYPKWRDTVVLIQIASSSSELPDLESQISKIAMRINSNYSTLTHQPLVLLKQDISFSQFLALMSVAEIFMVTSLREGMNLTGHEFVQCQDGNFGPQKYGSLILSEFTGSASIFNGHKLLVNPWDYHECAEAIDRALELSPEEKQRNWQFLVDRMTKHTATSWCDSYLKALSDAHSAQAPQELAMVSSLSIDALKEKYDRSHCRLFILEDQGTLDFYASPKDTTPVPEERKLDAIRALLTDPKNVVYITSSRTTKQLEMSMKDVSGIGMIAENGCFLREPGKTEWEALLDESDTRDWRWGIRKVMQYFQERTDGSLVEERRFSLTFWYKDALDQELAMRQASDLADQINGSRGNEPIRAVLTDGAVTVEPTNVTKASTAELAFQRMSSSSSSSSNNNNNNNNNNNVNGSDNVNGDGAGSSLSQTTAPDFLLVVGGSRNDESLFRWANKLSQEGKVANVTTITVGTHATTAATLLKDDTTVTDVLTALISSSNS